MGGRLRNDANATDLADCAICPWEHIREGLEGSEALRRVPVCDFARRPSSRSRCRGHGITAWCTWSRSARRVVRRHVEAGPCGLATALGVFHVKQGTWQCESSALAPEPLRRVGHRGAGSAWGQGSPRGRASVEGYGTRRCGPARLDTVGRGTFLEPELATRHPQNTLLSASRSEASDGCRPTQRETSSGKGPVSRETCDASSILRQHRAHTRGVHDTSRAKPPSGSATPIRPRLRRLASYPVGRGRLESGHGFNQGPGAVHRHRDSASPGGLPWCIRGRLAVERKTR